jgi:hypothetical protein
MDINISSALMAFTTQSASITPAARTQQANANAPSGSVGAADSSLSLGGSSSGQALTYGATSGMGPKGVGDPLSGVGGGAAPLLASSDGLPMSAMVLAPASTEAMVRYAYDQSQNPAKSAQQTSPSTQQGLLVPGLNLLA